MRTRDHELGGISEVITKPAERWSRAVLSAVESLKAAQASWWFIIMLYLGGGTSLGVLANWLTTSKHFHDTDTLRVVAALIVPMHLAIYGIYRLGLSAARRSQLQSR